MSEARVLWYFLAKGQQKSAANPISVVGWHFFRFQKHVRIADEIREPARLVAGQPADQMQQRRAFGQVERRAQPDVIAADIEAQRNLSLAAFGMN